MLKYVLDHHRNGATMNYIVLDLEWNQCPNGKEKENKKIPFEIIEIGAVKLDQNLNVIDTFSELIRPQVYRSLHYKIREISKITMDDLKECRNFKDVVNDFLDWCGEDVTFCTWGALDLTELQRNIQYYKIKRQMPFPFIYLDIQKLFSIDQEDGKIRRSLSLAVEYLQIEEEEPFHRAVNDAMYTCKVMRMIQFESVKRFYSIDCYYVPRNKKDEIYVKFDHYSKYISRKFSSKESAIADEEVSKIPCFFCDQSLPEVLPWFSDNSKTYYAIGYCDKHGYMQSRIRMKKTANGLNYVIKITKPTTKEGSQQILARQDAIREKRRERRLRQAEEEKES